MPSSDYNKYLAAIKAANDMENKRAFAADQKRAYRQLRPHGRRRGLSAPAVPLQRLTDRGVPRPQAGAPLLCGLYGRPMLQ